MSLESFFEIQKQKIGQSLGTSAWITVTQEMITTFGEVTLDPDPMHIDPEWCKSNSPFGCTIVFGFQTISLLTHMIHNIIQSNENAPNNREGFGLNYGFNRLRLISPVPVNSRLRLHATLSNVEERNSGELLQTFHVEMEIEGREKPALIADWLAMLVAPEGNERVSGKMIKEV